jgi:hypothetical protein
MNLRDLTPKTNSNTMGNLLESYFQKKTRFTALNESSAKTMLTKVTKLIKEYKMSEKRHTSEKDKGFLSLMFMQEGLQKRLAELAQPGKSALNPNSPEAKALINPIKKTTTGASVSGKEATSLAGAAMLNKKPNAPKDPVADQILKKAASGQSVSGEESKKLGALATNEATDPNTPDAVDKSKAQLRKERQARMDRLEDERAERGVSSEKTSASRTVKGASYGGSKQKVEKEVDESSEFDAKDEVKDKSLRADPTKPAFIKKSSGKERSENKPIANRAKPDAVDRTKEPKEATPKSNTPYKVGGSIYETFSQRYTRFLAEGADIDQAQVVLAAQDMVDSVQDMLEKAGKMKIDELYPLSDTIKSTLGTDKAGAFTSAVDAALQGVMDALQNARQELAGAVAGLTGDEMPADFAANVNGEEGDDLMGAGDMEDMGNPEVDDLGLDLDSEEDADTNFGRERR